MEASLAAAASRQHGVVARHQLIESGFTGRMIEARIRAGRLHRIHPGVYAVGHPKLSRQGYRMAAVLAGGRGADLSHRAAGAEWGLRQWSGRPSITVPKWRRSTAALEIHTRSLPADERTVADGIPITTVPRTLLDLATVLDRHDLARAVNEAEVGQFTDKLSLPALLERHRGDRGAGALRAVLDDAGFGKGITAGPLEELFLRFVSAHSLPHPELNAHLRIGDRNFSPDCLWRRERVIVELDGLADHETAQAITRDAGRDRRLLLAGWTVSHVTWSQLHDAHEAMSLARDLRALLTGGS